MIAEIIESERLICRPLSLMHLSERYVHWLNDPVVGKFIVSSGNYSLKDLENYLIDVEKKQILFWGIHLKENGKHIGNIKIDPVIEKHGLCEYGIMMGDKYEWGKGYAREASKEVINYCFKKLKLRKMTLGVSEYNVSAVKLYFSLGFEIEGRYKRHEFYDGNYYNALRMALFNPSYVYK